MPQSTFADRSRSRSQQRALIVITNGTTTIRSANGAIRNLKIFLAKPELQSTKIFSPIHPAHLIGLRLDEVFRIYESVRMYLGFIFMQINSPERILKQQHQKVSTEKDATLTKVICED